MTPEREERVAWIEGEIVGIIEATKPPETGFTRPAGRTGLIDLAQEPENAPDLNAGAAVD